MTDQKAFSLRTFWGRYLVFTLLLLPFSLTFLPDENSDFSSPGIAFLFHYAGCHVLFWILYIMLSLQFTMMEKSQFSFSGYTNFAIFSFWLVGITIVVFAIINSTETDSFYPLNRVSFGLTFCFTAYNLQLKKSGKRQGT